MSTSRDQYALSEFLFEKLTKTDSAYKYIVAHQDDDVNENGTKLADTPVGLIPNAIKDQILNLIKNDIKETKDETHQAQLRLLENDWVGADKKSVARCRYVKRTQHKDEATSVPVPVQEVKRVTNKTAAPEVKPAPVLAANTPEGKFEERAKFHQTQRLAAEKAEADRRANDPTYKALKEKEEQEMAQEEAAYEQELLKTKQDQNQVQRDNVLYVSTLKSNSQYKGVCCGDAEMDPESKSGIYTLYVDTWKLEDQGIIPADKHLTKIEKPSDKELDAKNESLFGNVTRKLIDILNKHGGKDRGIKPSDWSLNNANLKDEQGRTANATAQFELVRCYGALSEKGEAKEVVVATLNDYRNGLLVALNPGLKLSSLKKPSVEPAGQPAAVPAKKELKIEVPVDQAGPQAPVTPKDSKDDNGPKAPVTPTGSPKAPASPKGSPKLFSRYVTKGDVSTSGPLVPPTNPTRYTTRMKGSGQGGN